jgi:hypothetical protein
MRRRRSVIGALNLFHSGAGQMQTGDVDAAQALADIATITILQHRAVMESGLLNDQLNYALQSRIVIEQAKGMVGERGGLDMGSADHRWRLQHHSPWLVPTLTADRSKPSGLRSFGMDPAVAPSPRALGPRPFRLPARLL